MKKLFLIMLIAAMSILSCGDPNKFTSDNGDPHATKIIVKLGGTYANDFLVDVTIGTGGATTIGKGLPPEAYATVDPGSYTVTGVVQGYTTGTFAHTTTVKEGEQKTVVFNLNDATLVFKPSILFAGKHNHFRVTIYTDDETPSFVVGAGETGSYSFKPGKTGNMIHIADADTGEALQTDIVKIFFGGTLTYTLD